MLSMKNMMRNHRLMILLPIGIAALLFTFRISAQDGDDRSDMLAYVSEDNDLMLYNPRDRSEVRLLENVGDFALGRNGRIAFTKADEQDSDLYVFDPASPAVAPINISEGLGEHNEPLGWRPDERYLAFGSYDADNGDSLYVWDGETSTKIMPNYSLDKIYRFYVHWSDDGRLAFTAVRGGANLTTEIYLWDVNETFNISQNPGGDDAVSGWSQTGQLLFGSRRNDDFGSYVWDGVSFKDGAVDVDSFIRIPPEFDTPLARWTEEGFVAFIPDSETEPSGTKTMVIWDIENEVIVEQFPISSENTWSWLGKGGEMIFSSDLASGIPSLYLDIENREGEILFSEHTGAYAWSADGYLGFCGIDGNISRLLSIWDGEESWVVATVSYKTAQWQEGRTTFSCNNG